MSTKLSVIKFDHDRMASDCEVLSTDEIGLYVRQRVWVDLTVNGDLGEMFESELVGKTVTVDRFQPHEFLGIGVRLLPEGEAA